jgi:hypothetical protein
MTTTTAMNPEIRSAWTGRLRSGDIPQGAKYLGRGAARCCLGVLCDLAGEAGNIEPRQRTYYDEDGEASFDDWWDYGQGGNEETLPDLVQDWAGLSGNGASNPLVQVPDEFISRLPYRARNLLGVGDVPDGITLAQLNDAGVPFGLIADIIDATL